MAKHTQDGVGDASSPSDSGGDAEHPAWFYSSLVDKLPVYVVCKDLDGRVTYFNRNLMKLMGLPPEEIRGKTDYDFFPEELATKYRADDQRVIETGQIFEDVEENRRDGAASYMQVRKIPFCNPQGEIIGVQAVFWDVTRRRQTEAALEHEQYLLHALMDNLPDGIYFKDAEGRFLRVSKGQSTRFRLNSPEDAVGKTAADILSHEQAAAIRRDERRIMRTGQPEVGRVEKESWEDGRVTWCSNTRLPLRDRQGQVVGTFGISRDVTELVEAEEALWKAKEEADAANRAKSDFLANMSHEIRTPMNAIIGMTELLLDTEPTPVQQEYLTMVLASGESLLALINDILDFSKIEAGKFDLDLRAFDIRNAIGDTVKSLGFRAHERGLELAFSVDASVPEFLVGDVGRIRQILINLVGNAIKFTDHGEVVLTITCRTQDSETTTLLFSVRDTGVGIPQEKIDKVFAEFEQADASTTRDYGGTGLGLTISARLVEMMGGEIWVESQPGVGSNFRFTAQFGNSAASEVRPPAESVPLQDTRVLIVDDNQTNRRILQEMLLNWGLRPFVTSSGPEALEVLLECQRKGEAITLVLTDGHMPEMDGYTLTQEMRADPGFADLPVIMLTSSGRPEDRARCQDLQIAAQLIKPVKQSEVFEAIVTTLGARGLEDSAGDDEARDALPGIRQLKILLAEDNLVNQKLAVGVLQRQGHEVVVAANGEEAVAAWEAEAFDLILMDVQMPELDGYEATRIIRQREQPRGTHIPIIAMTARAMKGDRERCLESGMDEYLAKPIRMRELAEKLATLKSMESDASPADQLPPKSDGPVDWDAALESAGGSSSLLKDVVRAFLDEVPTLLTAVDEAIAAGDIEALHPAAHSLKGSLLFMNATAASNSAERLETMPAEQLVTDSGDVLASLKTQLQEVIQAAHQFLG